MQNASRLVFAQNHSKNRFNVGKSGIVLVCNCAFFMVVEAVNSLKIFMSSSRTSRIATATKGTKRF